MLGSIAAVEFFSDRQLDFLTDEGAYQPYQVCGIGSRWRRGGVWGGSG